VRQQLENMQKYTLQSIDELHHVITDLRPSLLDELGLVAALRWYAAITAKRCPLPSTLRYRGDSGAFRRDRDHPFPASLRRR